MKGSDHRVLFQNADDTINMGVIFNDPDVELSDIHWYVVLAEEIDDSKNANLITVDRKLDTRSCYVELHRFGELNPYWQISGTFLRPFYWKTHPSKNPGYLFSF